jgi:two-component system, chemotaxis family, sensor kinase CheA
VHLVTSITIFEGEKSLFNFLLTSPEPDEIIQAEINTIDGSGEILKFSSCSIIEDEDEDGFLEEGDSQPSVELEDKQKIEDAKASDDLDGSVLMESIGQFVTLQTSLNHLTRNISNADFSPQIDEKFKEAGCDWNKARYLINNLFGDWTSDLNKNLTQICYQLSEALEQCREYSLKISEKPIDSILDNLQKFGLDLAHYCEKHIKFEITGHTLSLDRTLLRNVEHTLKDLIWFSVVHSIEKVDMRREIGKPLYAGIVINFEKTNDKVKCTIKDDGNGFKCDALLNAAQTIDKDFADFSSTEKCKLILDNEFNNGLKIEGEAGGVDFADLNDKLEGGGGMLHLNPDSTGLDIEFTVPLTRVVLDGMVVKVGNINYIIPVEAIRRILNPDAGDLIQVSSEGDKELLKLDEEVIPITSLSRGNAESIDQEQIVVIIIENEQSSVAFPIDGLVGQEQVLVKGLQGQLTAVSGVSGYALLGSGDIGMVVDVNQIVCKFENK